MSDLDRSSERSLTQQLVDAIAAAIESGELRPEEKLPPTRELAELAGVNHLTAVRAYRRLRELGLVTAHVGRGTFVRGTGRPPESSVVSDSIAWQRYALPEYEPTYGDQVLAEMHRQATAEHLIPLSVGYPSASLFPIEEIREATGAVLHEHPERALQYSDVQGVPELREQIAALSAQRGSPEDIRDIVCTTGASQALTLATRAIVRPGDAVACEDPSFMSVLRALRTQADVRVVGVPVDEDGLDVDALEALLARNEIRMLAIQPRLHNPTGRDLSPERRERLLALVRRHGFFVIEDGIYADLRFEGESPPSLRSEAPAHVIYCDSLSKTVGGGLRAGWVAASGPILDRIVVEKRGDDIHSPSLTQLTVARYLGSGAYAGQAERARRFYREQSEHMIEAVEDELGSIATWIEPLGGGHLWVTLDLSLDERELADEALREGVAYAPGGAMRIERSRDLSLRLSYGYLDPDQMREGVRRFAAAVERVRARAPRAEAIPV
ncbi:MAG: PLP-dependent aminotransferase family protein [Solirubrobacterales bacterium]